MSLLSQAHLQCVLASLMEIQFRSVFSRLVWLRNPKPFLMPYRAFHTVWSWPPPHCSWGSTGLSYWSFCSSYFIPSLGALLPCGHSTVTPSNTFQEPFPYLSGLGLSLPSGAFPITPSTLNVSFWSSVPLSMGTDYLLRSWPKLSDLCPGYRAVLRCCSGIL